MAERRLLPYLSVAQANDGGGSQGGLRPTFFANWPKTRLSHLVSGIETNSCGVFLVHRIYFRQMCRGVREVVE